MKRPSLAQAYQPFFSTSPWFSAHASASPLSLQGSKPLSGHPKTLRDFALTEVLSLPASFGAISLGEVFSSAMCVNNESNIDIMGVQLKIEMQTATTKIPLAELGGPQQQLSPNEALETVASHEIKEVSA